MPSTRLRLSMRESTRAEAFELLQQVIQLNPEHFRTNLLLGRIHSCRGKSPSRFG